jgi:hypothetical protein
MILSRKKCAIHMDKEEKKDKTKSKKKLAPIIITIIVILFSTAYIWFFIAIAITEAVAWFVSGIAIMVYLALCVGIILALRERIKEIDEGEEDEALKY